MKNVLPTESLLTLIEAGITHIKEVPTDVIIRKNNFHAGELNREGVELYLKSQYNIGVSLQEGQMHEEAFSMLDKVLSNMYSVASPDTLYYRFDTLDQSDLPYMYLNAIMHYAFDYYSTSKELVFDIGGNRERIPVMKSLNLNSLDTVKPILNLKLVSFSVFIGDLYKNIIDNSTSISDNDLELIHLMASKLGVFQGNSQDIINRDVAMVQEASRKEYDKTFTRVRINSLSDLLRYANIISYWKQGSIYHSQVSPERLKLTTSHQKIITSVFYNYVNYTNDVRKIKQELAQHVSEWKKVFMLVNKYSNKDTQAIWEHFREIIFTKHLRSQNSEIESAVRSGEVKKFDRVFHKYPSLAIRHLVDFNAKSKESYLPSDEDLDKIPGRILLQVTNRLSILGQEDYKAEGLRLSKFKGMLAPTPENKNLSGMRSILLSEANKLWVYLQEHVTSPIESHELPKSQSYDLAMNTDNLTQVENAISLPYLSRVILGDDILISPMIYWDEPSDLDLSAVFYDKDMQQTGSVSFTDLHYSDIAKHSGDITHASKKEPAVERILINRQKALENDDRYVLVTTTVYTGDELITFKNGVATYDELTDSSKMYSAEGLANLGSLQAQGTQLYLFIIDLKYNIEYVIGKPLGNQNLKGNNTYSMYNKNKTVAELVLRDEKDVLHFSDLYDKGLFVYQPETQLEMLNKLN